MNTQQLRALCTLHGLVDEDGEPIAARLAAKLGVDDSAARKWLKGTRAMSRASVVLLRGLRVPPELEAAVGAFWGSYDGPGPLATAPVTPPVTRVTPAPEAVTPPVTLWWRTWRRWPAGALGAMAGLVPVLLVLSRPAVPVAGPAPWQVEGLITQAPEMVPVDDLVEGGDMWDTSGSPRVVPESPLPGQQAAPCPADTDTINGGCWIEDAKHVRGGACPDFFPYGHDGKCYAPARASTKRPPPKPSSLAPRDGGR